MFKLKVFCVKTFIFSPDVIIILFFVTLVEASIRPIYSTCLTVVMLAGLSSLPGYIFIEGRDDECVPVPSTYLVFEKKKKMLNGLN